MKMEIRNEIMKKNIENKYTLTFLTTERNYVALCIHLDI